MAVTIVPTPGSATANSYVSLAEAEVYCEARLNVDTWDAASDDTKNRALVESTRELTTMTWDGWRVTSTQALAWPRQWALDPDSPDATYFDSTIVPQRVKDACCELALQFVLAGTTDLAAIPSETNIKRKKIDVLETEYFSASATPRGLGRFPRVMALIRPLLAGSGITTSVVRG